MCEEFWNVNLLMTESDYPRWPCVVDGIKIQLPIHTCLLLLHAWVPCAFTLWSNTAFTISGTAGGHKIHRRCLMKLAFTHVRAQRPSADFVAKLPLYNSVRSEDHLHNGLDSLKWTSLTPVSTFATAQMLCLQNSRKKNTGLYWWVDLKSISELLLAQMNWVFISDLWLSWLEDSFGDISLEFL